MNGQNQQDLNLYIVAAERAFGWADNRGLANIPELPRDYQKL